MVNSTRPLRLAVGAHAAGTNKGCVMNVISWENVDSTVTDMPACADEVLARIVQRVNDSICTHRYSHLLCLACSVLVLDLAPRVVGTGTHPLTALERRRVWMWVAADQVRQVLHVVDGPVALAEIEAAEEWATEPNRTTNACVLLKPPMSTPPPSALNDYGPLTGLSMCGVKRQGSSRPSPIRL